MKSARLERREIPHGLGGDVLECADDPVFTGPAAQDDHPSLDLPPCAVIMAHPDGEAVAAGQAAHGFHAFVDDGKITG